MIRCRRRAPSRALMWSCKTARDCEEERGQGREGQLEKGGERRTTLCTRRRLCTSSSPVQRRKAVSELCCSGLLKLKMRIPAAEQFKRGQQMSCCA